MRKFFIKTLGCKTNQLENDIIAGELVSLGYKKTADPAEAYYYILNSCAVTQNAVNESLYLLKNVKKKYPLIKTVLAGCAAQIDCTKSEKENCADMIIGNTEKLSIADYIDAKGKIFVGDISKEDKFINKTVYSISKTRGSVKIQDGCDNYCTYCTIPLARGHSRSNSVEKIIEQVNIFAKNGVKEVVLTGIHIGQWGRDFEKKSFLVDLLKKIEQTAIQRYRLGSLNPLEPDENLIGFLKQSEKFCPHFHLSLQSMSDKILKLMNRHYSFSTALDLISRLNSEFNIPFLGSDIIVGFPDESEDDFIQTYENIEKSELSQIHVFPYSRREHTKAFYMDNQVEEAVKKQRAQELKKLSEKKHAEFLKKNLNTKRYAQIQKNRCTKSGLYKGLTDNYINILVDCDESLKNEICEIKLDEIKRNIVLSTFEENT